MSNIVQSQLKVDDESTTVPASHTTTVVRVDADAVLSAGGPLHPVLAAQLRELRLRTGQEIPDLAALLTLVSGHYAAIDEERRGIVRTLQVMADEARALSYQATHDPLTGLLNRREFNARLEGALQRTAAGERHVLLYLDLDQFKVVNDTCGHQAGDRLLGDIAGLLRARVRADDAIARLGGDEFVILLRQVTVEQATTVAEAVREAIHDYRFQWEYSTLSVGASIGVVELDTMPDAEAVMNAADVACYAAKYGGRNRVRVYRG